MGKKIKYINGQEIGNYGVIYNNDVAPYISPSGIRTRQADFVCPSGDRINFFQEDDETLNKIELSLEEVKSLEESMDK